MRNEEQEVGVSRPVMQFCGIRAFLATIHNCKGKMGKTHQSRGLERPPGK